MTKHKVDLLVPVMNHLATWTRPVVMIPGNHDQVTLGGGMHALTPLQFAFADPQQVRIGCAAGRGGGVRKRWNACAREELGGVERRGS